MTQKSNPVSCGVNVFENNAEYYGSVASPIGPHDHYFLDFLSTYAGRQLHLLDVGGGSGNFATLVTKTIPDMDVVVVDPCAPLLEMIGDARITKIQGALPYAMNLSDSECFDFIHIKEVLHHVVGDSIRDSKEQVKVSLNELNKHLDKYDYLLISEIFYEGHIVPTFPRTLIFHVCRLQDKTKIKIPTKEFLEDLSVCFYTRDEFASMLHDCGYTIVGYYEKYWGKSLKTALLGVKERGRMLFIVKKGSGGDEITGIAQDPL